MIGCVILLPMIVFDILMLICILSVFGISLLVQLMDEPDWDIYYWVTDKKVPPSRWANSPIIEKLKVHARNEGKVVRRMPDLS